MWYLNENLIIINAAKYKLLMVVGRYRYPYFAFKLHL